MSCAKLWTNWDVASAGMLIHMSFWDSLHSSIMSS